MNSFYLSLLSESVREGKLYVSKGKITQDELESIIKIDPTPQKKYVGWMCKQWANKLVSDMDDLRNTIEEWNSFLNKNKTKNKDIYAYNNFSELKAEVNHLNDTGEGVSVKDLESDYEVIRDDNELLIMSPHTHEASRKLGLSHFAFRDCAGGGKDSAWCTTYKASNHFNDYYYKHNVTFYYIKVRSEELQKKLEASGYGAQYFVSAIAVLDEETAYKASQKKLPSMDAYDGLDKQFTGEKLTNYLNIIGVS
jgi:hypothetical protein